MRKDKDAQLKAAKEMKARADRLAKEKEMQVNAIKRTTQEIQDDVELELVKKPKFVRNDISMLDLEPTPSKGVELDGDDWMPPVRGKEKSPCDLQLSWRQVARR